MRLKAGILTSVFMCLVLLGKAQTAVKLGLNRASLSQDKIDYTNNKSMFFYQFGLGTAIDKEEPGFRAEFLYSVKGRKFESKNTVNTFYGSHTYETEVEDKIPYFDMPLLFTFPIIKGLIVEAGPNLGIRLGGKRTMKSTTTFDNQLLGKVFVHEYEETTYRYSDKNAFPVNRDVQPDEEENLDRRPVARYDLGLNIGLQYFIARKIAVACRYNFGLVDVLNDHYLSLNSDYSNRDKHRNLEFSINFYLGD